MDNASISWRTSLVLVPALLAACVPAGCGSNDAGVYTARPVKHTEPPMSRAALARAYLFITGPANDALSKFRTKASGWGDSTTGTQAAKDAAPAVAALRRADSQLLRLDWGPSMNPEVRTLVTAHGAVIRDLGSLRALKSLAPGPWLNRLVDDSSKASAAAQVLRKDLGLPQSKP